MLFLWGEKKMRYCYSAYIYPKGGGQIETEFLAGSEIEAAEAAENYIRKKNAVGVLDYSVEETTDKYL